MASGFSTGLAAGWCTGTAFGAAGTCLFATEVPLLLVFLLVTNAHEKDLGSCAAHHKKGKLLNTVVRLTQ